MSAANGAAGKLEAREIRKAIMHRLEYAPATEAELIAAMHFATAGQVRAALRRMVSREHVMSKGSGRKLRKADEPPVYYLPADLVREAAELCARPVSGRRAVPRHGRVWGSRVC